MCSWYIDQIVKSANTLRLSHVIFSLSWNIIDYFRSSLVWLIIHCFCHISSSDTFSYIWSCVRFALGTNLTRHKNNHQVHHHHQYHHHHTWKVQKLAIKTNTWSSDIVLTFKINLMIPEKITHDIVLIFFIILILIFFTILITIFFITTHFLEPSRRCWGRRRRRFSWSKLLALESSCCTSSYS